MRQKPTHGSVPTDSAGRTARSFSAPVPEFSGDAVFSPLDKTAFSLIIRFGDIAKDVFPLDQRRRRALPERINVLSHLLTDNRSDRRVGYMNDPSNVSAYVHYFMWWNLLRFAKLFAGLFSADDFPQRFCAVDVGAGPLTAVCALWIACPEFRRKEITWYCVDISRDALAAGEELFLRLAASTGGVPWEIIRVRGSAGEPIKKKAELVICANVCNEMFPRDSSQGGFSAPRPTPEAARDGASPGAGKPPRPSNAARAFAIVEGYAAPRAKILLIEPGNPEGGSFVSAFRKKAAAAGFVPLSPCPHSEKCPFPGGRGEKWCHFAFPVDRVPEKLKALSDQAGLPKIRAALSFVYVSRAAPPGCAAGRDAVGNKTDSRNEPDLETPRDAFPEASPRFRRQKLTVRVVSDEIALPQGRTGRYACSCFGMVLLAGKGLPAGKRAGVSPAEFLRKLPFGAAVTLTLNRPPPTSPARDGSVSTDPKTGAVVITLFPGKPGALPGKPDSRRKSGPPGKTRAARADRPRTT